MKMVVTARRKKTLLLAGVSLVLCAGVVIVLILMIRHEPAFYHRVEIAPGKDRYEMSTTCISRFLDLKNNWQEGQKEWDVIISEAHLNSWFEEHFISHGLAALLGGKGISNPRIAMENDKLRLAFRYGEPPWSAIISYDLKLWLAKDQMNVICIEFLGRHAGALPMTTQSILNEISDVAAKSGFEVSWYRHEGNPVALVRIQAPDHSPAPAQVRRLEVKQGWISIGGVSQEPVFTINGKHPTAPLGN
jgi:hypothetical protein